MRLFVFTALAAGAVLASAVTGGSTDANATVRHPHRRAQATVPYVHQNPYTTFNTFDARGLATDPDWNPISGTPRWNALGTAP